MYISTVTVNLPILFICIDHVNIVQNKSGYDVINNSIVNAFNNPERSIVLDCVTSRGHENAMWEVQSSSEDTDMSIFIYNLYLSTITLVDPGINTSVSLKCKSDTSMEYRTVTVTTGTILCTYVCIYVAMYVSMYNCFNEEPTLCKYNFMLCIHTCIYLNIYMYIFSRKSISEATK